MTDVLAVVKWIYSAGCFGLLGACLLQNSSYVLSVFVLGGAFGGFCGLLCFWCEVVELCWDLCFAFWVVCNLNVISWGGVRVGFGLLLFCWC